MASAAQTNQNAISNTPQAKDDVATAFEAGELISIAALMANDAGGNGKSFYGIYGATTTSWGATLTVENGSIRYDGSGSARLQSLAQGQTITDTFQYAIQLGKGVISIATVKMTITGTNDGPVAVADTATTSENQVVVIDALANDIDIDNGAVKSLVSVTSPKGTASIEGGKVRFDPGTAFDHLGQGATELVTLTYAMRDEHGFVSESTIRITVTGVNDGPVAIADVAAGSENQTLVIDVLSNDTDVDDGATQTLVSVSAPKGSATVVGNKVTFDPGSDFDQLALGQTEVVTLTYTMRDEHGAEASATVTVTVTGTNDAPVAVADTAATDENGAIVVDVLANDTDVDAGATQTLTAVSAPKGAATIVANKLAFDPGTDFDHLAVGQSETIVVAYTMADEHGATASSTLTITITGTNDAPVAVADAAATTENAAIVIDALANDTDVDSGAVLTLTSVSAPKGSATIVDGKLAFDPGTAFDHLAKGATETVTLSYTIADERGATSTSTVTVTVTGTNDAPVVTSGAAAAAGSVVEAGNLDNGAVVAGTPSAAGTLTASDVDDGATRSWSGSANGSYGSFAIDAAGAWTYTLDQARADVLNEGQSVVETFTATVTDEHGATATQVVTIAVTGTNDAPTAAPVTGAATEDGGPVTIALAGADKDGEDDVSTLTYSIANGPGAGTATIDGSSLKFDPGSGFQSLGAGQTQQVTVGYIATDARGATSGGTQAGPVTTLANFDMADLTSTRSLTADAVASGVTVSALTANGTLAGTPFSNHFYLSGWGTTIDTSKYYEVTFNPNGKAIDFDTVRFAMENAGANNATWYLRSSVDNFSADIATGTLTNQDVTNFTADLNGLPVAAGPVTFRWYMTSPVNVTTGFANHESPGSGGGLPDVGQDLVFTGRIIETAAQTATITVTGVNDAPVAIADTATVNENGIVLVSPLTNDTDVDAGDTKTLVSVSANKGSATVVGNQIRYDSSTAFDSLNVGQFENVELTYTMRDAAGATSTSTVTVRVNGANDAPVAVADSASTNEDTAIAINVRANDTDVDNATGLTVISTSATSARGAAVSINADGTVGYNPTAAAQLQALTRGQSVIDTFNYTVRDANGGVATATVSVNVAGVLEAPTARPDNGTTAENSSTTGNLLANDTFTGSPQLSGNILTNASFELGHNIQPNTFGFVASLPGWTAPNGLEVWGTGFLGNVASDGNSFLELDNGGAQDAYSQTLTTQAGREYALSFDLAVRSGTDPATNQVEFLVNGVSLGVFTPQTTSFTTFTVNFVGSGTDVITFREPASSNNGVGGLIDNLRIEADADVFVTAVNGSAAGVGQAVAGTNGGSFTVAANGTYSFNPGTAFDNLGAGQTRTSSVSYTLTDDGGSSTSTATVTVTGANDAPVAVADSATTQARQAVSINALANDTDVDAGDSKTLVSATAPKGTASVVGGQVRFDPGNAFDGLLVGQSEDVTVAYTMRDAAGATSSSTITVKVNGTNVAPVAADTTLVANRLGNGGFDATPNFDGWTTSTALSGTNIDYGSTVSVDRSGTLFPNDQAVAVLDFAAGVPAPFGTGQGPSIVSDAFEAQAGETVRFTYRLSSGGDHAVGYAYIRDADTGAIVQTVFEFNTGFTGSTGVQTKDVVLTQSGNYTLEFRVGSYDATGGQYIGAKMEIGFAGVIREGIGEGTPFTFSNVKAQFLGTATDANGDPLSIQSVAATSAKGGLVTYDAATGALTYDPNGKFEALAQGQSTTDTITYTVADGRGGTDTATATITVTGENDAPTLNASAASRTLVEAGGTSPGVASALVQLSKADVDGTASYDLTGWTQIGTGIYSKAATYGTVVLNTTTDALVYNLDNNDPDTQGLAAGQTVTDSVSVSVTDGALSATKTAVFTINGAAEVVVNGFETGLDGWQTIGSAARTMGGAFDGDYKLTLDGGGATDAEMEAFLGIAPGTLDGIADGDATVGSAALKTITLGAGETFSMHWFFGASDPDGAAFNDFGFVRAPDGSVVELASQVENGNAWFEYSYTATTAGAYTFGFGTVNVNDESYNSPLHLDGDLPLI